MSLSNQEREEILSMWFDKVVGLMLRGINCITEIGETKAGFSKWLPAYSRVS